MLKKAYYILLAVIFSACSRNYMHKPDDKVVGQTPPPDMVFVPGNGDLPSFYMGFTEECNLNYNTYLAWLQNVYVDYPEVYKQAVPQNRDVSDLMVMSDPYYKYYQNHPAFAYYPVTGVSWAQVQDYMSWKTDRLNEAILMDVGILDEENIYLQSNEHNFNTEAYLNGQYDGLIKKDLDDLSPGGTTRKVRTDDGILFTGFHLPTEAEWDYVVGLNRPAEINNKNYKRPFSAGKNYPYGKKYFTLRWARAYGLQNDKMATQGWAYNKAWDSSSTFFPARLTGPADYQTGGNRIANLEGNVQEWLLDVYTENPEKKPWKFVEYFTENTFPLLEPKYYNNADGFIQEKDSLGKLPFRYFVLDATGEPYNIRKFGFIYYYNYRWDSIYFDSTKDIIQKQQRRWDYGISEQYFWYDTNSRQHIPIYKNINGYYRLVLVSDIYNPDAQARRRVVKGGTWRKPDAKARAAMMEDQYSPNVGFRCVMAYNGLPVKSKYKVKWK